MLWGIEIPEKKEIGQCGGSTVTRDAVGCHPESGWRKLLRHSIAYSVAVFLVDRAIARARRRIGGLDYVIPPEIKDDDFYRAIIGIASQPGLGHILEIGASGGAGSTEAFVSGILANPDPPILHCIEVSAPRYDALVKRYADREFVRCYRVSSVPAASFPSPAEVEAFHRTGESRFSAFPLKQVLGWLDQDVTYVRSQHIDTPGIQTIRESNGVDLFGAVLIDGSEFTGVAELREVYGARFLLLDDICTYKNYANFRALSADPKYRLVESSERPRNGYAVFERTD